MSCSRSRRTLKPLLLFVLWELLVLGSLPAMAQDQEGIAPREQVQVVLYRSNRDLVLREQLATVSIDRERIVSISRGVVTWDTGEPGDAEDRGEDGPVSWVRSAVPHPPGTLARQIGTTPVWEELAHSFGDEASAEAESSFLAIVLTEPSSGSAAPFARREARWLTYKWGVLGVQYLWYETETRPVYSAWIKSSSADPLSDDDSGRPDPALELPHLEEPYYEQFRYDRQGALRAIRRCTQEECVDIRYAGTHAERIVGADWGLAVEYGDRWQPVSLVRTYPDGRTERETRSYTDGVLTTVVRTVNGRTTRTRYEDGKLVLEEQIEGGFVIESLAREYDSQGRLAEETVTTRRTVRESRYEYGPEGSVRVTVLENGRTIRSEDRRPDGVTVVTEYFEEKPVVRIYLENGTRFREEVIVDGQVVRTREYEP